MPMPVSIKQKCRKSAQTHRTILNLNRCFLFLCLLYSYYKKGEFNQVLLAIIAKEKLNVFPPVLSLNIQRCNHDRSATHNLTPISRCFKYIFSHFYPYFAQNGYKLAFKKHPYFSHSKYTFTKPPLFSQFQVYTFTKPPLYYKSFIYIFFVLKNFFFFFFFLKHITNKEKSSYGVNTQVGHTNH